MKAPPILMHHVWMVGSIITYLPPSKKMPRTSSPSAIPRQRAKFSPISSKPTSRRQHSPSHILELSSDDSALSPLRSPQSQTRSPSQPRPKNVSSNVRLMPSSEVIEISSDEDDAPLSQESAVAALRKQVSKLKQVCPSLINIRLINSVLSRKTSNMSKNVLR